MAALAVVVAGCNNSLAPEPPAAPEFTFTPTEAILPVFADTWQDFKVTHQSEPDFRVRWWVNGEQVAIGPRFRFFPSTTAIDTITARATGEKNSAEHTWFVRSMSDTPTAIGFTPASSVLDVVVGDALSFSATSSRAGQTTYDWLHNGQTVGQDSSCQYQATATGTDSVQVIVTGPDRTLSHQWLLHTFNADELPPAPPGFLQVSLGVGISDLTLSWQQADHRRVAITSYQVAISYEGPISDSNWAAAQLVYEQPFIAEQVAYRAHLAASGGALIPGNHIWLAVTSNSPTGVISKVSNNAEIDISESWWVTGVVRDEAGVPIPNIDVIAARTAITATTGPDGHYRIGPFSSIRRVVIITQSPDLVPAGQTMGAWFDATSDTLAMAERTEWDFLLISRGFLVADCDSYHGLFLNYLRSMTHTWYTTPLRPNYRLYKWSSYPITVWIPSFTNQDSLDYTALCQESVRIWNQTMGRDFLTLVADAAEAQVTFRFGNDGPRFMGKTFLNEPSDERYVLSEVIPEQVEVYLLNELGSAQLVEEVALHELGHALGLSGHAVCGGAGYLMSVSPAGALNNGEEHAIHPDEIRALNTIRSLPQGVNMSYYLYNLQ